MDKKKLNILLIEDNPGDAFLIKFYLEDKYSGEYNFHHVDYLKLGLEALAKDQYDAVLLDMDLPDSFGIDTVKEIMSKFPQQLVLVLTGLNDEEVGLKTINAGAQDYLVKGKFDGKLLHSTILHAAERVNSLNEKKVDTSPGENHCRDALIRVIEIIDSVYMEIEEDNKTFRSPNYQSLLNKEKISGNAEQISFYSIFENEAEVESLVKNSMQEKSNFEISFKTKAGNTLYLKGIYAAGAPPKICILTSYKAL